jgi:tRNA modification GTPase
MFMISTDTIVALSSSPAVAARAIVRLSGNEAKTIASAFVALPALANRFQRRSIRVGSWQVPGSVCYFQSPRSYTGEDLVEFHLPGNRLISERLIKQCIERGARLAEPGEFTARAYFNGKMDLTQAEGVAASIGAMNQHQLDAARQLLAGELARRMNPLVEQVAETLALLEAGIDFVDEDISFISQEDLSLRLASADRSLEELVNNSARFGPLGAEPTIALVGRPNAGKSTLLNCLAKHERAIVSPIAGTTRDALSVDVVLAHGVVKLIDIAGLEQNDHANDIEQQMQSRARQIVHSADVIVSVMEAKDDQPAIDTGRQPDICVRSKIDLGGKMRAGELAVSALTHDGIEPLRQSLDRHVFGATSTGQTLALNSRHLQAITNGRAALARAMADAHSGHECVALHLREALDELSQITGAVSPDDVLGKVFAKFCIGK